ncbi:cytochrome P450 71A1-like [Arachis duranensis]|uniref:Cytochrome P450 71A1-like n=1 Tax=Arachis duranensis TaxID=130453 RepID=A0A6P4CQ32_ARADU|nr:cytochrome P450 71A1-like [Arachis duranensis]
MSLVRSIQEKLQHQPHSITLSTICFIIITILCIVKFTRRNNKFNNLPPSPPKLPIIGNLHQLGTLPHQSLKELANKYGPLLLLQLGQTQALVVSSAELVEEIAKSHDIAFSNRANTKAAKIFFYQCKEVGFAPYGEEWRMKRKLCVLELLSTNRVRSFQPIRKDEVSMMINTICEACAKGSIVNLSKMIITTANNISSRCIFGRSSDGRKGIGEVVRKMMSQLTTLGIGDLFPSLNWVDVLTGFNSRLKVTFAELDAFLEEVIEEHKRKKKDKNIINDSSYDNKDFVDIFLQLQEKNMLEFELTGDTIRGILMDMFVGGSDTVSTTLEWAFSELAKNPKCMKKAQEEVRRIVDGKSKIEENHLNQMNYMKCVLKETLRLHPPVPLLVPRETSTSVKLNGYNIPNKTTVYVNSYAIHRDPKLWENAEEFIPERFEGNNDDQQVDYKVIDFQLIPFGIGRRGCPGVSFGIASAEYLMANLLYWFDWKVPNNNSNGDDDFEMDMSELSGMTVTKKQPLYLQPILYSFHSKS